MTQMLDDFAIEPILAAFPGDNPAGADPRADVSPASTYFRLRDARAEARDMERQAEASGNEDATPPPPWRTVRSLAERGLAETAKDLELATWLTEALVRASGLRGLATGACVIAGLVERHWDHLYPLPDEDGIETRVAPLAGLSGQGVDGTLMQPLRKTVLFRRPDGSPFGYWQYELSAELASITDPARRQQRLAAGVLAFDEVEKEARQAGGAHWAALAGEITGALDAWNGMTGALDGSAGSASPSTSRVRDLLLAMQATAARFAPAAAAVAAEPEPGAPPAPVPAAAASGTIAGRDQALRHLSEIADWFKRHEPNSPLGYTLDEAVRRARLTWPELVAEMLPDEGGRNALLSSLGIRPPAEPG